ncbi:carbonic anhydrase [Erwinia persicina]|uniref:carbonic anhydrase n=1 Tax=Erwinia persicina TaxID=55211 RepID=UPI000787F493|nr:carbonic anhydrase [Erwinia persicina]AXU96537.1 carbonic anhydrase [Erwinia persicina]MBC3944626.1 carbonic anhydrase [Erwinia persicina]MCQ4094253.1 carbonic anhydrase [Erwinia persicina]MCQ4101042.1 carbonic anhydrase [Erwinia persicina]MCQ4105566.1 carbonic anhydrase [Erwinia persicina]
MTTLKPLLAKNRSWALQRRQRNPHYFRQNVDGQQPHALWIGCSDSRVPAEVLTGAHPGELFVHRNIANMVVSHDDNFMSVLQYALEYLKVSSIVLCGHYGCGGVQAALTLPDIPLGDENSPLARRITQLRNALSPALATQAGDEEPGAHLNRLVEANVLAQFSQLVKTDPVLKAWREGVALEVFGCVYDLHSGHLKELVQQTEEGIV